MSRATIDCSLGFDLDDRTDKPVAFCPAALTPMTRADDSDRGAFLVALTFAAMPPTIEPATFSCLLPPYTLRPVVASYASLLASPPTK
jgi:hypothetical protein